MTPDESAAVMGRPMLGKAPRVAMSGTTITPDTELLLTDWSLRLDCSRGLMLDQLVSFAKRHGFPPKSLSNKIRIQK